MFSPDGRRVITVSSNRLNETNKVRVWDTESGTEIAVLGIESPRPQKSTVEEDDRSFSGISAFGGATRASGLSETEESRWGFPFRWGCASLRHAHRNLYHRQSVGSSAA